MISFFVIVLVFSLSNISNIFYFVIFSEFSFLPKNEISKSKIAKFQKELGESKKYVGDFF